MVASLASQTGSQATRVGVGTHPRDHGLKLKSVYCAAFFDILSSARCHDQAWVWVMIRGLSPAWRTDELRTSIMPETTTYGRLGLDDQHHGGYDGIHGLHHKSGGVWYNWAGARRHHDPGVGEQCSTSEGGAGQELTRV